MVTATVLYFNTKHNKSAADWKRLILESSCSPQVPPPRQSYLPGGVTILALPAVFLCPL